MSQIGYSIANAIAVLEDGENKSEFGYKINYRDLKRFLSNMGREIENREGSFREMAERIQQAFMGHFENDEGPDPLSGQLQPWPTYNLPEDEKQESYIARKIRKGYGSKLMRLTGDLEKEITDPSNIRILGGNNPGVEISSDLGYGIFGHLGFTGKNGRPTPAQTRRTIFDLTEDEENNIINSMMDDFFMKVDE